MLSYHNSNELKTSVLTQLRQHREADQLVSGLYWDETKGCGVGCLKHDPGGGHHLYPRRWGIPVEIAYVEDAIFEGLQHADRCAWPERLMGAIPVGVDLRLVWPRFVVALLTDPVHGAATHAVGFSGAVVSIERVAAIFRRRIDGNEPSKSEWAAAVLMASDASMAAAAAWVAREADRAPWEAAMAAEWAARAGARAPTEACAAERAAEWAARAGARAPTEDDKHWRWQAETLLRLVAEAPLVGAS